jgi:hypothetical protein
MKKNISLNKLLFGFALAAVAFSCDDNDDEVAVQTDFGTIASTHEESAGTVTIPLRVVGDVSDLEVAFGGTATEGEDFTLAGITSEGVQLNIVDDANFEFTETIRVTLSKGTDELYGNAIHNITLLSQCSDPEGSSSILSLFEELEGIDGNLDGGGFEGEGAIHVAEVSAGTYTIDGLNVDFMEHFWGEEIQESELVTVTVDATGAVTIPDQYIFTTLYAGDLYEYHIVGSGQIDPCTQTLTLDYEVITDGFEVGAWLHENGYMTDPIFKAVFDLPL